MPVLSIARQRDEAAGRALSSRCKEHGKLSGVAEPGPHQGHRMRRRANDHRWLARRPNLQRNCSKTCWIAHALSWRAPRRGCELPPGAPAARKYAKSTAQGSASSPAVLAALPSTLPLRAATRSTVARASASLTSSGVRRRLLGARTARATADERSCAERSPLTSFAASRSTSPPFPSTRCWRWCFSCPAPPACSLAVPHAPGLPTKWPRDEAVSALSTSTTYVRAASRPPCRLARVHSRTTTLRTSQPRATSSRSRSSVWPVRWCHPHLLAIKCVGPSTSIARRRATSLSPPPSLLSPPPPAAPLVSTAMSMLKRPSSVSHSSSASSQPGSERTMSSTSSCVCDGLRSELHSIHAERHTDANAAVCGGHATASTGVSAMGALSGACVSPPALASTVASAASRFEASTAPLAAPAAPPVAPAHNMNRKTWLRSGTVRCSCKAAAAATTLSVALLASEPVPAPAPARPSAASAHATFAIPCGAKPSSPPSAAARCRSAASNATRASLPAGRLSVPIAHARLLTPCGTIVASLGAHPAASRTTKPLTSWCRITASAHATLAAS
eukprot:363801-Chlamydomonas_euryale.AAC.6